ncbi:MAG: hypothetical protein IPH30_14300 [Betaproteobacteria bacterium]|nr:hypothetical protein [Betaproteobacteria bacterium]
MRRTRTAPEPKRPPPSAPEVAAELEDMRVIERADGFWAQPRQGGPDRGPYASLVEAIDDQRIGDEEDFEPGNALAEVEAELGVCDWIDPETSEPAEDHVPHIEEH